jgi:shikimate kinase
VGYRGTGKTVVAKLLAGRLGCDWLDADTLLEERHGCTIKEVFTLEGEAAFRDKEATLLQELSQRRQCVIATGGGVILRPSNRDLLRQSGLVVWLTADAATLWSRIEKDSLTAERRPNLAGGGLSEVEEMLRVREPLYREVAGLKVATEGLSPEEVSEMIVQHLRNASAKRR